MHCVIRQSVRDLCFVSQNPKNNAHVYAEYAGAVVESGKALDGLAQSDFTITAAGREVPVVYLCDQSSGGPMSVGIVIDASGM